MPLKKILPCAVLFLISALGCGAVSYEPSLIAPPPLTREFRGVWIATVGNIDWPSKPGLSTAVQKAELISLLDRAEQLKLNAVIFQVRPACDAFYASSIEPWSEYLTGVMGKAPQPFYDPLAFAVTEAHKRGMELHAWFNPYRALHKSHEGTVSSSHISQTHPEFVKRYGEYLWLDPGEREVQEYSLRVIMDVVRRYDIDGVHFDDYFYPGDPGTEGDFPDSVSWKKFGANGRLSRQDWRRENVNSFIQRVYHSIKAAKPWVKFGVSPGGIWRPGYPAQIKGFDAYARIYADSRKWLANGWLDYFAPQLYWRIDTREQSFPVLLDWWALQNTEGRHLWPGLAAYRADEWKPGEILNQIQITRRSPGVTGYTLYSMNSLVHDAALADSLQRDLNSGRALIPASSWLGNDIPGKPKAVVSGNPESLKLIWNSSGTNSVRWWVIQTRDDRGWQMEILPGEISSRSLGVAPEAIAVTAIDRFGNASEPRVLQARKGLPERKRILQND
jgi:uncharacterized lipoprotein YddW (UPF0748 family)